MGITSFTYRSNLNLVHKESLFRIAVFLGVSVGKSASKLTMIDKIDSYAKANPIEELEKALCEGTGLGVRQDGSRYSPW